SVGLAAGNGLFATATASPTLNTTAAPGSSLNADGTVTAQTLSSDFATAQLLGVTAGLVSGGGYSSTSSVTDALTTALNGVSIQAGNLVIDTVSVAESNATGDSGGL